VFLWTIFRITFSNSLPVVDKWLIGRKFCGNFGSLPGFGKLESGSELLYDWRFTANQFVLVPSLLRFMTRVFFFATGPLRL
jgi:hypothetical protein